MSEGQNDFKLPGMVDKSRRASLRVLRSNEEVISFLQFHRTKLLADTDTPSTTLGLFSKPEGTETREIESGLDKWLKEAFGLGVATKNFTELVPCDTDSKAAPLAAHETGNAYFQWCLDNLGQSVLFLVVPTTTSDTLSFTQTSVRDMVTEWLVDEVFEVCADAVSVNKISTHGRSSDYQNEAVRKALSTEPLDYDVVHALLKNGISKDNLSSLIRSCASSMGEVDPESAFDVVLNIVKNKVTQWVSDGDLQLPKIMRICVGTDDGEVSDYTGFTTHVILRERPPYLVRGNVFGAFSESEIGKRVAVVDLRD